jgi:zinc protease
MKSFRKSAPPVSTIRKIDFPCTNTFRLPNGIVITEIASGTQDILKMEVVHHAGRSVEDSHIAGRATAMLLREGTKSMSSSTIAEHIDFYGASIKTASNMDFSYSTLYTLSKYFTEVLPVFTSLYREPIFDEGEIEKFKKSNVQKLLEELSKNDVISYRQITSEIFGSEHPYGYNSEVRDYLLMTRSDIYSHFDHYYGTDNCHIFISGKTTDSILKQISDSFSSDLKQAVKKEYHSPDVAYQGKQTLLKSRNEHQVAIKIGRKLFSRHHPDHTSFFILNTILGGYFGSRLMGSIREKLGYTYDIFSSMDQMLYDGLFYISTEVSPEFADRTTDEIYRQMEQLRTIQVSDEELSMVKNYIMGNLLNFMDGPMNVSSFIRSVVLAGLSAEDFAHFVDEIHAITPYRLMETANRYLTAESMAEVRVLPE